jgi:hypothetical protein
MGALVYVVLALNWSKINIFRLNFGDSMNKILISLLILALGVAACSGEKKETKESTTDSLTEASVSEAAVLPVTFLPLEPTASFPDAILELSRPLGNQVFKPGKVPFEFNVKNFALQKSASAAPNLLMILNGGDPEGYHAPIFQRELTRGTYRTVAFLVDAQGLALKNFGNYIDRDFLVGDSRPFPYSAEPYLAVNLPRNEQILPLGEELLLDFLVLGGDLKLDGLKIKISVNTYVTEVTQLSPLRVANLPKGDYQVNVQLLRVDNKELEGPFSSSTKTVFVR